jgi:diadenosine tetraphosphatase ApaH/serine/threonine PP2A family protein phosphatase
MTALNAVLEDAQPVERVWCLGDVIGYGPDPNECIECIRALPRLTCVKGNHDAAILGEIDTNTFNYEARASLEWLETKLLAVNRHWLESLPERTVEENVTFVHGSPRNPIWEYVMDVGVAEANMAAFDTQICLVGHSHVPGVFLKGEGDKINVRYYDMIPGESFTITEKAIINPGSVGQPRDYDPRASYLIYDDEADLLTQHRVPYNIPEVQERIMAEGLPERHAFRLEVGW